MRSIWNDFISNYLLNKYFLNVFFTRLRRCWYYWCWQFVIVFSRSVRESAEEISWTARIGVEDRVGRWLNGGRVRGDHHYSDHDDGSSQHGRGGCCGHGHRQRNADRAGPDDRYRSGRGDRDQRRQCVHIVRRDRSHIASALVQLRLYGRADQDATPETRSFSCNYYILSLFLFIGCWMVEMYISAHEIPSSTSR